MPISMYTVSIPVFIQHLNGLNTVLDKAAARDMPNTSFLAPLYRSPICIASAGADKGKLVSFKY